MNPIGIMQGRLSPPVPGRLQAFPWVSWEQEFQHARLCEFDTIEWIFEVEHYEENPIWTESGRGRIYQHIISSGVQVHSLCADYFMAHPFFRVSKQERKHSIAILNRLICQAAGVGIRTILLPVLEVAEIRTTDEEQQLLDSLHEPLSIAMEHGIRLGLETELPVAQYRTLIEKGNHPALGVYYDTGNATAKGYQIDTDIRILGPLLCGIHIKDRKRDGPSMLLGQGDANFSAFFKALAEVNYSGSIVLQTAFGEDYLGIAKTHRTFIRNLLSLKGC
jgi:L-ribulose-5-phosphate 3-epimerase